MAATDKELGALHKAVAEGLTQALQPHVTEEGKVILAPAAYFGAAIAMLKNNNITADPTTNKELQELQQALHNRRHKKLGSAELQEAASEFARANGDMIQ